MVFIPFAPRPAVSGLPDVRDPDGHLGQRAPPNREANDINPGTAE